MTLNYKQLLILGVFSSLMIFLFVGQFYDHHGDKALFIKNSPTFRQIFSRTPKTPVPSKSYDAEKKDVDIKIEEDVFKQRERESPGALFIASILIQMSIMFLVTGYLSFLKNNSFSFWQLIIQFSINFLVTLFAVTFMLFIDDVITSLIFFLALVVTNYLTVIIYSRLANHSKMSKLESTNEKSGSR